MTSYEEAVESGTLIEQAEQIMSNDIDRYEALRQQIGELADELATFTEKHDPRSATFRVAAKRLIESLQDRLTDMYNGS